MVVANDFDSNSLKILKRKKNLILLKIPEIKERVIEFKSTIFGDLYQTRDLSPINKNFLKLVTKKKGLQTQLRI